MVAAVMVAAAITIAAASANDGATIVNSGSTNANGYTIQVWSDATADVAIGRPGALGTPKPFSIPSALATQFFADLAAARDGHAAGQHCMKSASFGTSMRVQWHGWTSPDLTCPPAGDALTGALVHDTGEIISAAKITPEMLHGGFTGEHRMVPMHPSSPAPLPTFTASPPPAR
jgi:hypothetical protein